MRCKRGEGVVKVSKSVIQRIKDVVKLKAKAKVKGIVSIVRVQTRNRTQYPIKAKENRLSKTKEDL